LPFRGIHYNDIFNADENADRADAEDEERVKDGGSGRGKNSYKRSIRGLTPDTPGIGPCKLTFHYPLFKNQFTRFKIMARFS
jgi:hypothetical protein